MREDMSLWNHFQKMLWITGYFTKIPAWQDHHGPFMFIVQRRFCGPSVLVKGGKNTKAKFKGPSVWHNIKTWSRIFSPSWYYYMCVPRCLFSQQLSLLLVLSPGWPLINPPVIYILAQMLHFLTSSCLCNLFSLAYLSSSCLDPLELHCGMQISIAAKTFFSLSFSSIRATVDTRTPAQGQITLHGRYIGIDIHLYKLFPNNSCVRER